VGGTNPSLVEALAAGNPVVAHDNPYNRWVAGEAGLYFRDIPDATTAIDALLADATLRARLAAAARARHEEEFTWEHVAGQYEQLLVDVMARAAQMGAHT
jgi:glycosyltransferase involved in cell wall biosynthesis